MSNYVTSELELASFLKARGHRLLSAGMDKGRTVAFEFESTAADDAINYFHDGSISAKELFGAHRSLRALIQQVREHSSQSTNNIGKDISRNEQRPSHSRR